MNKHYEIKWSIKFQVYNCKDKEDAVNKLDDIFKSQNNWDWDSNKTIKIKEISNQET
tara:strand:- start:1163 stop:1333 length:171 start_codon:yes stop_codon:yes gene_type:complete